MVQAMPVTVSDVDTQPPPMVVVQQPPQPVLDVPQDASAVVENAAEDVPLLSSAKIESSGEDKIAFDSSPEKPRAPIPQVIIRNTCCLCFVISRTRPWYFRA